jgi:tetratricopeptide (TPR) repeat protein
VDSAEIWAALAANNDRTDPAARAARAEYLVDAAEATGDTLLLVTSLQQLISAFEFNGESDKMLTPFARVLRLWDTESGSFDSPRRHTMFWQFKWTTSQLLTLPQVPLGTIRQWLDEMESRYRQAGYSSRPVHQSRHYLASHLGHTDQAGASFDAWLTEPRDVMADCEACERNAQGDWHEEQGDDEQALELWAPVLDGELTCAEEPHRLLAGSLLPLLRLGRADQARGNHLRGYRMARGRPNLRGTVGEHLAFCALSGNTARGLEILAEHKGWLENQGENISKRRSFLEGVSILLRRLEAQGLAELPVQDVDVRTLRISVDAEIDATCARYDVRNGNTHVSDRSARRRAQQPLIDQLPLGSAGWPGRRPGGAGAGADSTGDAAAGAALSDAAAAVAAGAAGRSSSGSDTAGGSAGGGAASALADQAGVGTGTAGGLTLDELLAEARALSTAGHPRALAAWERIARTGDPEHPGAALPPLVQAQIDRARARTLLTTEPAAALPGLRELADRFAALDAPLELLLKSRSDLAIALFLSGDREQAEQLGEELDALVEKAYADGELASGPYLSLRSRRVQLAHHAYSELVENDASDADQAAADATDGDATGAAGSTAAGASDATDVSAAAASPDDPHGAEAVRTLLIAEAALADQLGDPGQAGLYQRMLAQFDFAAERLDRAAVRLTDAAELFLAGRRPWAAAEALGLLGQLHLRQGLPDVAEQQAQAALEHGADLIPAELLAQLSSLLVEAMIRQDGRDADLVDAALRAAGAWAPISEPDALHNRFTAARAYLALKQYGEAAALFEEFMPHVAVPYEAIGIAQTREQFATCLSELGEHRQAAEQLLAAARLVQNDPENQRAHARLAWTAAQALERAGQPDTALPAFRRAADLWRTLGAPVPRARCLRSAAWLLAWINTADQDGEPDWPTSITAMRDVLTELTEIPADQRNDLIAAEVENTKQQLTQMLEYQARTSDETDPQEPVPDPD